MREGLAVFESSYIADCAQAGDIRKVPLGRYFLPSMKLQQGSLTCPPGVFTKEKPERIVNQETIFQRSQLRTIYCNPEKVMG